MCLVTEMAARSVASSAAGSEMEMWSGIQSEVG